MGKKKAIPKKNSAKTRKPPKFLDSDFRQMVDASGVKGIEAVYANDTYIVEKYVGHPDLYCDYRLVIKRWDKKPIHNWLDFQHIKNSIAGPERVAVEVYPPASELVDTANIYHLWIMYENEDLPWKLTTPDSKSQMT